MTAEPSATRGDFVLFEALLWEPGSGYFLLERHLERLARSAAHFGFPLDVEQLRARLEERSAHLAPEPRKLRVELARSGAIALGDERARPSTPVATALARDPVDSTDEFLRHKTSRREVYESARTAHPEAQDVLLWNERHELTETCSANVVVEIDGRRVTPPVACGLLPGTFRAYLLDRGEIAESVVPVAALARASGIWLVNSVRRWCELALL